MEGMEAMEAFQGWSPSNFFCSSYVPLPPLVPVSPSMKKWIEEAVDPLMLEIRQQLVEALKSAYHHVHTEPITDAKVVVAGFDFNDTSEPVGEAFPAESNATVFAILA